MYFAALCRYQLGDYACRAAIYRALQRRWQTRLDS
jgi:hypothetical protein